MHDRGSQHTPQLSCEQSSSRHGLGQYDCQHIADICEVCFILVMSHRTGVSTVLCFDKTACCALCGGAAQAMHQSTSASKTDQTQHGIHLCWHGQNRPIIHPTAGPVTHLFGSLLDVMLVPVQCKLCPSFQNGMNLLTLLCEHANTC